MEHTLYFVVESDALIEICQEWRRRYSEATDAALSFAKSKGASGYFPGLHADPIALTVDAAPLNGWKTVRATRRGLPDSLFPVRGQKGATAREELEAVMRHPRYSEISDAIGHPCTYRYKHDSGCGMGCMGSAFTPVNLGWAGDQFIITAPDAAAYIDDLIESYPGCVIEKGHWTIPEGIRRVSKAEADLIYAQWRVTEEREMCQVQ